MAAALRNAAMRLRGRALQPTQVPTIDERKDAAIRLRQIDERKEALYNLIADLEMKYKVPGRVGRQNARLVELLSVQVQPRYNDLHWLSCQTTQSYNHFVTFVGGFTLGYMIPSGLYWLITEAYPNPNLKKIALDSWNDQKQ